MGLKEYHAGNGELTKALRDGKTPSRTPHFLYNVDPPDNWQ